LAGSRQSYCKNYQAYFFGSPCRSLNDTFVRMDRHAYYYIVFVLLVFVIFVHLLARIPTCSSLVSELHVCCTIENLHYYYYYCSCYCYWLLLLLLLLLLLEEEVW